MYTNKNEVELRYKIDELNAKILKYESVMRENKEEFYLINTENSNLKSDLKNLTNLERALRNEISNLVSQRQELEDALLRVKTKISKDALELRKYETENEALHRQVMSMENTITIATKEVEDLKNENDGLKDWLNSKEKEVILLKRTLERKESELQTSRASLSRANSLLEAHQSSTEYYETTEKRVEEPYESRASINFTPEYPSYSKKAAVPNSIQSSLDAYSSPISTYRRQASHSISHPYFASTPRGTSQAIIDNVGVRGGQGQQYFTPSRQVVRHEEEHNFKRTESEPRSKLFNTVEGLGLVNGVRWLTTRLAPTSLFSQIQSMRAEKRRLEEEFARLPIVQKSAATKRRKEHLEKQLDQLEKNISLYSAKLKSPQFN